MIYGEPTIHVDNDVTDRIGIRTLVLSQLWQASSWPLSIIELDAEKPDVPEVPGGVLFIGEQTRRDGGAMRTSWTFEGINGDGKSVTFRDRSNSYDYNFEGGFAQVPIVKHPAWEYLKSTYGGSYQDGQVIWPEVLPQGGSSDGRIAAADQSDQTNPMFGQDDFLRMDGTYSFRYASPSFGVAMQGIGWIAAALPGFPPPVEDGRNWLKAPTQWQRRGVVLDITEVYWLSGAGGWIDAIYGQEAQNAIRGIIGDNGSLALAGSQTLALADVSAQASQIAANFFP